MCFHPWKSLVWTGPFYLFQIWIEGLAGRLDRLLQCSCLPSQPHLVATPDSPASTSVSAAMITHHLCLLHPPLPAGLRGRTPHAFLSVAAASSPPPPPLRLRPLRAVAGGASPVTPKSEHRASNPLLLSSHASFQLEWLLVPQVGGDGRKRAAPPPLGAAVLDFARSNFLPLGELADSTRSQLVPSCILLLMGDFILRICVCNVMCLRCIVAKFYEPIQIQLAFTCTTIVT